MFDPSLQTDTGMKVFLLTAALWSLPWKGWALWRAARREDGAWFIALLLVNTLGLLDILYVFVLSKDEKPMSPVKDIGKARKERGSMTSASSS